MELTKLTLKGVWINDKDKNGNIFMSKDGRPYKKMSVKAQEYGDKYISGFCNKQNENWKAGDTVEVIIKPNGEYLNFEVPKKDDVQNGVLEEIKRDLGIIKLKLEKLDKLGVLLRHHTSPTEGHPYGINMANHPLNSPEDDKRIKEEEDKYSLDDIF